MKIKISETWCREMATMEADAEVSAGILSRDPTFSAMPHSEHDKADDTRLAFGRFVNLMRRQRGLSMEKLAEDAELDIGEVLSIEEDAQYDPGPRTIYQLASTFDVSHQRLLQLSGLAETRDEQFVDQMVRYAARSENIATLNAAEQAALDGFISALSEK